jgi:NAD(P)H-dependent FMN reductase
MKHKSRKKGLIMDVLIVYDAHFSNTAFIARIIATTFEKFAHVRMLPAHQTHLEDIEEADLLVVGGSWGITPALQHLIDGLPRTALKGIPTVVFDTHPHRAGGSVTRTLSQSLVKHGASLALPPESFIIGDFGGTLERGEPDHASAWALSVISKLMTAGV